MRKKLLSILVLSILVASTLVGCSQGQSTPSSAIFSTSGGNVSVMKAGTASWIEAQVEMTLEPGDIIKSGDNSSAEITFLDGSTIELQAGTEIEVVSLDISTETDSTTIRVKQTIGSIIFRVTKLLDPASRYEVETPTGVVVVRGSVMQVYVIEDGTTWVTNLEGDIWAVAQGVELQIPEGRQCIIRRGQPPELTVAVCNLTISSTTGGSVTIPGEGTFPYNEGTVVGLVAIPDAGHQFDRWIGDVDTIANVNAASTVITMNGNYSITANFEAIPPHQYNLTISSTAGGSVTTPGEGTYTYDGGTVVGLVAIPDAGYQFDRWIGDVDTIANVNAASTVITMNGNYSITANFEAIPPHQYNLTISSTAGGSVTTPGEAGPYTYDEGTVVNLVATPDVCCRFVNWTGDVGTIANVNAATTTMLMNGDYSIIANFEEEGEAVTFPDPNLEAVIRTAIDKPTDPIYPSDLEALTLLEAQERNISDLTGLECCTSLIGLDLTGNQIIDISPLANLTSLTELQLYDNQIIDISPLANLTHVDTLILLRNQISDISPLANLTSLTEINLDDNLISDISPLADLTGLTQLYLDNNQISDISPLANLTNLTILWLMGNQISDISPLANLTNLLWLWLQMNQISDIPPLPNLTSLIELRLDDNHIGDISNLANLTSLTDLYLEGNQIINVSPLANLANLTQLYLGNNVISDISPLANLTSLTEINLDDNLISDISPLADLTGLTQLYLDNNQISDIPPLPNLTNLASLSLGGNQISNISPLVNLTSLEHLYLWNNQIGDISPLANLTSLIEILLDSNQISDISPLVDNEGLSEGDTVWLLGNPLSQQSINEYIPQLEARGVIVDY